MNDLLANLHPTIADALRPHIGYAAIRAAAEAAHVRRAAYIAALRSHDWHHEASDDARVWRAGREQRARLMLERAAIDPDCEAWNCFCPPAFRVGVSA